MYINPIHAGAVAQAYRLAAAARVQSSDASPRKPGFHPLQRFSAWLLRPVEANGEAAQSEQLMLWSECAGRNYVTALGGLLVMKLLLGSVHGRRKALPVSLGPDRTPDDIGTDVLGIARRYRRLE